MQIGIVLVSILFLIYIFFILLLIYGWYRIRPFTKSNSLDQPFLSVVIPFRNEAKNISALLNDLFNQSLDKINFEIILVNDHSDDESVKIINQFKNKFAFLLIHSNTPSKGKKQALSNGIRASKGELILSLDADTRIESDLLSLIINYYSKYKSDMIICPVFFNKNRGFLNSVFSLEFASLLASGAGALGLGQPIMCNGACLAFKRELYLSYGNRLDIISGDDMFLMLHLKKEHKRIHYLKNAHVYALTDAPSDLKSFISQRTRWVSKDKAYRDAGVIETAIIVFLLNTVLAILFVSAIFGFFSFGLFLSLFGLKSIADLGILWPFLNYYGRRHYIWYFIPTQLLYIFYVPLIAIWGNIAKFEWKNK